LGGRYPSSRTPSAPVVSNSDGSFVLTGIIQQGEDCLAFFEDTRTGKTATVGVSEALGRGRLVLITQDIVHYACDGDLKRIEIGSTLAGTAASFPKPVTTTTTATSTTTAAAPRGTAPGAPPGIAPGMPAGPLPAGMFGGAVAGPPGTEPFGPGAVMMTIESGGVVLQATPPAPPPATAAGTSAPQPPAAPPQAAAGTSGGVGGSASVEERMRQRREQELNK
jgi:hypothetical protein